ncbi:MAG TPA: IMP cyclohydrolase [Candidatus Hydrogenedentes bacterium]|nr:IMP cyclohydrolase [Candidatus Hydrogenedentota bacterium]
MPRKGRAILSCHDKTGVVELAQLLAEYDVEIISTSGTLALLQEAGVPAVSIADFTGIPELMGGRVKSLHPKVHAGLLGIRDSKLHQEQMQAHEFPWIDMVVVNLQPVKELMERPGISPDEVVEQIDIGGAAMMRSAAKNFRYVTVVVNPQWYARIRHELHAHDGATSYDTRFALAREAYECVAAYDAAIAAYLKEHEPKPA